MRSSSNANFQIPGSYAETTSLGSRSSPSLSERINDNSVPASESVDKENSTNFINKQIFSNRRRLQHHLISQLNTLVYILIGYQFIKYCHSACIFPALLHISIQQFISADSITSSSGSHNVVSAINFRNRNDSDASHQLIEVLTNKTSMAIYLKSVFTLIYHITFIFAWLIPLAEANPSGLINGSWWFISFIGESVKEDIANSSSLWMKMSKSGLIGLLITDFGILLMQLILYQCIFKQSTLVNKDNTFEGNNPYFLTTFADLAPSTSSTGWSEEDQELNVLKILLYETFKVRD